MAVDMQQTLQDFEKSRADLMSISSQKQQLELQNRMVDETLEVLDKTKEKKVYKAVGNIMVLSDRAGVEKELKEQKETLSLRVKTLQKQEDTLINKLNKLKSDIESAQGTPTSATKK